MTLFQLSALFLTLVGAVGWLNNRFLRVPQGVAMLAAGLIGAGVLYGLKALAPYAHTNVHAKYWNRWKDNDVRRSVKIMMDAGFEGTFALEYEDGPWDGVEGSKYLYKEVLAAL